MDRADVMFALQAGQLTGLSGELCPVVGETKPTQTDASSKIELHPLVHDKIWGTKEPC